jgi:Transposase DDE domain
MISSKSPRKVARVALAAGKEAFSDYSHRFSPKKFTQPQLFACLVLKEFERKDYRGIAALLEDATDLRDEIGLKGVPHYTTLQKASQRLLRVKNVRVLLDETVKRVRGRKRNVAYGAVDSSGFDAHHASRYFIWRTAANQKKNKTDKTEKQRENKGEEQKKQRVSYKRFGKLMLIVCCATHAILAAVASVGPTPDIDQLDGVMAELAPSQTLLHLVGDAGFDSGHNHQLLREEHGVRSTIPPEHGRPPKDPNTLPTNKYRRRMKTHFNKKAYRKRPQVETVFSMLKRNFGASLRARSHWGRNRDLFLRVLTHNIALALLQVFYRAWMSPFQPPAAVHGRQAQEVEGFGAARAGLEDLAVEGPGLVGLAGAEVGLGEF